MQCRRDKGKDSTNEEVKERWREGEKERRRNE